MNGAHISVAGGATALLAQVLMYLTHFPLQPMDNATAMAFAGLIMMVLGGGGITWFNMKTADAAVPAPTPVPEVTKP